MVKQIEDGDGLTALKQTSASKLVVIDFFADWCGPCKRIAPVLDKMDAEFSDVDFAKINVDEFELAAGDFKVEALPTFVLLKGGVEVDRVTGASEAKLKELILQHKG